MLLLAEACYYGQWKAILLELKMSDGWVRFGAKLVGVCHGETLSSHHLPPTAGCCTFLYAVEGLFCGRLMLPQCAWNSIGSMCRGVLSSSLLLWLAVTRSCLCSRL